MTLTALPSPNFTGAELAARVNAAVVELRAARSFPSAASLLADTSLAYGNGSRAVAAGDRIVTAEGIAYQVAAAGAADHHVATAGGVRLHVLPGERGTDIRAIGARCDGVTSDWEILRTALALFDDIFIPGVCHLGSGAAQNLNLLAGDVKYIRGNKGSRFQSATGRPFRAPIRLGLHRGTSGQGGHSLLNVTTANPLASDAAQGASQIVVSEVTGVQVGDGVRIHTNTLVDTNRTDSGDRKNCLRRVAAISGTTITLDQPLDFWFTAAETTTIEFYAPATVHIDGVGFYSEVPAESIFGSMSFSRMQDCSWRNALIESPRARWDAGPYSDPLTVVHSDRTLLENMRFRKGRYDPNVIASRFTTFRNCVFEDVRHPDCNGWSQDTLYEDCRGIRTDGIIQSHPAIRTTWRRCHDQVDGAGLYGIDLRGVGEIVEDCSAVGRSGVGSNTNAPTLDTDYRAWARARASFDRRITRFKSPTAKIGPGFHRRFIVEACEVPEIRAQTSYTATTVEVDDRTIAASDIAQMNGQTHLQPARALAMPLDDSFVAVAASLSMSAIAKSNPAVVTSTGHGLANGARIRISGVSGMPEVNGGEFVVANVTATTFSLKTTAGVDVDSTAYGTYASGGVIRLRPTPITGITRANPGVVTAPGHGLANGDFVRITNPGGMTELDYRVYKAAGVSGDSFSLQTTAGVDVDTTGYAAYTSGGYAMKHKPARRANRMATPWIGRKPKAHYVMDLGATTAATVMLTTESSRSNVHQRDRWGFLTVRALGPGASFTEAVHRYRFEVYPGAAPSLTLDTGRSAINGRTVTISNVTGHFQSEIVTEGAASIFVRSDDSYWWFDLALSGAAASSGVDRVEIEVEEWIA